VEEAAKEHHKALFAADLVCQEELKKGDFVYSLLIGDRHSQVLSRCLSELGAARDGSDSKSSGEKLGQVEQHLHFHFSSSNRPGRPGAAGSISFSSAARAIPITCT
jgi:hypothetical protein